MLPSPFRSLSFSSFSSSEEDSIMPPKRASSLPFLFYLRSSHSFISLSVAITLFTNSFLYGLIVPVLPFSLKGHIGVSEENIQLWVSTLLACFGAGVAVGSVIFGRITYRNKSHRIPSFFGLVILLASTITLAYARSLPVLLVGRFIQGLGSAVLFTVALTLLSEIYRHRPETIDLDYDIRLITIATSGGILLGPVAGGFLYENLGYNAVYITAIGLIAVDIVLELMLIERKEAIRHLLDDEEEADGVRTPLLRASRRRPPSLRRGSSFLSVVKKRKLVVAIVALAGQGVVVTGLEAALPLHLLHMYSYTSSRLGYAFLVLLFPLMLSPLLSNICYRVGNKSVSIFGFVISSLSLFLLRLPTIMDTTKPESVAVFGVLLAVLGVGLGCIITSVLTEVFWGYEEIEKEQPGRFGAVGAIVCAHMVSNASYGVGITIGPLIAGPLRQYIGFENAMTCLAVYCLFNVLPIAVFYPARGGEDDDELDDDYSRARSPPRSPV